MSLRSLCSWKSLAALTLVATLGVATPASASIIWNWSFGGTEAGTFTTTDGDTSTVSFTILAISVTASSQPALVGASLIQAAPTTPQGFLWDGSAATQFFSNGSTSEATFFTTDFSRWYTFTVAGASLAVPPNGQNIPNPQGQLSLAPATTLAPPPPAPPTVPEPMTLTLLALGCAGMAVRQRSRRQ